MNRLKIVCVGAGNIGRSWALAFATAGHEVVLCDEDPNAAAVALTRIEAGLGDLGASPEALGRISLGNLAAALSSADYVQESIPEDLTMKRALFARLAAHARPTTIFGSSTSGLPGSAFMGGLSISARALVVHPTNPPHLVPLTELCLTPWTTEETYRFAHDLMSDIGQAPVRLNREITGYALNRLQAAVFSEAMFLVGEGYISATDLDRTMTEGLGLRWAFMGPFLTGHLNANGGVGDYLTRYQGLYRSIIDELRTDYPWSAPLIEKVAREIGSAAPVEFVPEAQRWRDGQLLALRRHLAAARGKAQLKWRRQ